MSEVKEIMPVDGNGNPTNMLPLQTPAEVNGAPLGVAESVQSAALVGKSIRIFAVSSVLADNTIRFLVGSDPTALATSHPLAVGSEIWYPIKSGEKIAIYGGLANIAVAGRVV